MCTRSFTTAQRHTFARSPKLPTQSRRELRSFCLRFTTPLLATAHFRLLAHRSRPVCHRRLSRHRLWRLSALHSRRFCLASCSPSSWHLTHPRFLCPRTVYSGPSMFFKLRPLWKCMIDCLIDWQPEPMFDKWTIRPHSPTNNMMLSRRGGNKTACDAVADNCSRWFGEAAAESIIDLPTTRIGY